MPKRGNTILPVFIVFFLIALLIVFLSYKGLLHGMTGFFEQVTVSLQRTVFTYSSSKDTLSTEEKLREENTKLLTQLASQQELARENKALRDQFETAKPVSSSLLPVRIIGRPKEGLLIDKGTHDAIQKGQIVVYKDNLIGVVEKASMRVSFVQLVSSSDTSFTAKTVQTDTSGLIKGAGRNAFLMDNVLLSEKLQKGDIVVTKGDRDESGVGFPPGLVVGKILDVNKKASDLFQTAEVNSLVDNEKLEMVFVLKER